MAGFRRTILLLLLLAGAGALAAGCADPARRTPEPASPRPKPRPVLPGLRHTVQAGAFLNIDNAVRLTRKLLARQLPAYHFIDESGFYKVRIGNFTTREQAVASAEKLKAAGVIEEYFVIAPAEQTAARYAEQSADRLRQEIVKTAERFIGVPYRWGGESTVEGFDCSGLTMAVYQLNGLDLPRTSAEQYRAGRPVAREDLAEGDLVFFSTQGGRKVSHVGLYAGEGSFLHAPRRGGAIERGYLSSAYYSARYLGGRAYF
jgi:cell wall-associated NlpC family hydrolase